MNFRIIKKTSNTRKPKNPSVHIGKNGTVTINEKAVEQMGLKVGDRIALIQDNDKPDDFYFLKMDSRELPVLRRKKGSSLILVTGYKDAYVTLKDHFNLPEISIKLTVGGAIKTPHGTAWALITSSLKNHIRKEVSNA